MSEQMGGIVVGSSLIERSSHTEFLSILGGRVRQQRDLIHMSRRVLSQRSNVSERYLAQLESGKGNMSIGLLRKVSIALEVPLADLLEPRNSL
ncbi:MAG: helix-turn-helix domain-containing protein [Granulosicoccaceae bacterium]